MGKIRIQFLFILWAVLSVPLFSCENFSTLSGDHGIVYSGEGITRERNIEEMKDRVFDVLVIGGGATGNGIAVEAAHRGLSIAAVERGDFASETSSRSTKLIHGGVRYLEAAVKKIMWGMFTFNRKTVREGIEQYQLVKHALHERTTLLQIAPHMAHGVSLLTPIYRAFDVLYFMTGMKMYDFIAGRNPLPGSEFVPARRAKAEYPMLNGKGLKGGVRYFDGQFNDARMALSLASSANEMGAKMTNYTEVLSLLKEDGKVVGAHVRDRLTGEEYDIRAKTVINATGPFADTIRKLDDPEAKPMMETSSGTHLILDKKFSPPESGILIPKTDDGRVIFILPWEGHTLIGTTDDAAPLQVNPKPTEKDVKYILAQIGRYFDSAPTEADVKAKWTGLRPLVRDPSAEGTADLSRDHVIVVSDSGMVTIAGGKWTTYRNMAEDAVSRAMEVGNLGEFTPSRTDKIALVGGDGFSPNLPGELQGTYQISPELAQHLSRSYGSRSHRLGELIRQGYGAKLSENHPYVEAEVLYATRFESARTAVDVVARRTRLGFLDQQAARDCLPRVIEIMGNELNWSGDRRQQELVSGLEYFSP